jgi:hypothetical protein
MHNPCDPDRFMQDYAWQVSNGISAYQINLNSGEIADSTVRETMV